ncbi:unnamed protein product [Pelagomonas calceolata]|uniref:Uncharacterized protein n=1 Tax=Pelagomonas calceolata TaxID=35677 RepID=A0A7S4E7U3_9STRA|nr:unnamed protein product [Pelagomonas calceolata]
MANQYRTLTRDIAASLRSQNVDAAAAGVALDAFAAALPDGKLKASLGDPGSEQRAAAVEAVEAHLDDTLTRAEDDLGADDDTLSALAALAAEAAFAKDAVALGKCCRDAAQTLGEAEIPLLDRSDGDGVAAAAQACVAALCASVQLLEDDVGDESDWRAGALAGCYAALLAQTSGRAEAALDVLGLLGFRGEGRDVRGFAEALAENAKDADAALKLLATLTGRSDVRSSCAASAAGRIHLELAARAAARLGERADDDDAAAVRRHVASVAPCPELVRAIAADAPATWLARADTHALEALLKDV